MRHVHRSRGFTLVELLIVVAIIGILAAVLTPQFLNARKVAADRAAEAYAHNVYTAVQAEFAEKNPAVLSNANGKIGDCTSGWTGFGSTTTNYPVPPPGAGLEISACEILNMPPNTKVKISYSGGKAGANGQIEVPR